MKLTRAADYAIRGVVYMAMQPEGAVVVIPEIAREMTIPVGFLARIFQSLSRAGIVISHRGKKGGYSLTRNAASLTLKDVIEAVEGNISLNICLDGFNECDRMTFCSIRTHLAAIQRVLVENLEKYDFATLAKEEKASREALKSP
ncbi:MAG: Rrf2 family transcriptional regulator [Deltaproteobacteria bacterium]|nr:Rrf2 family transcriptional regulator [Candidatus Anaeroferrophillus wilburensis]MBN2888454.1 Rrf2 family transcriptional regulator [Deltaproteobacteria bacterium]